MGRRGTNAGKAASSCNPSLAINGRNIHVCPYYDGGFFGVAARLTNSSPSIFRISFQK